MSKPITPERRSEIQRLNDGSSYPHPNAIALAVDELLDAEEYWRTQALEVGVQYSDDEASCGFCGAYKQFNWKMSLEERDLKHAEDCPWLLYGQ